MALAGQGPGPGPLPANAGTATSTSQPQVLQPTHRKAPLLYLSEGESGEENWPTPTHPPHLYEEHGGGPYARCWVKT